MPDGGWTAAGEPLHFSRNAIAPLFVQPHERFGEEVIVCHGRHPDSVTKKNLLALRHNGFGRLHQGQVKVRSAEFGYVPDGRFEPLRIDNRVAGLAVIKSTQPYRDFFRIRYLAKPKLLTGYLGNVEGNLRTGRHLGQQRDSEADTGGATLFHVRSPRVTRERAVSALPTECRRPFAKCDPD